MALRSVGPDPLAEAERVQQPDIRRHEDDHQREGEQQALDQLDRAHRTGRSDGRVLEAFDEPVEPDPARRLDEHHVAVAEPRRDRLERRLGVADADDPGRGQPGGLGALGDARCAVTDDDEPVDRSCGGLADGAMPVLGGLAQLEHLAEHRAPPTGQPGQQVERGDDRPRRGVVRVVDEGDPADPHQLHPVGRRPAGLETGRDLVERQAGDQADRGRGQRVVDRQPAERRDAHRTTSALGAQDEAHAVQTGRRDGVRADIGVGREAVGEAARRRAMSHPADDRVVGVEDRPAVRWQRLEQLALGRLDRLERADPGQMDRLDRGDHPDPRLGHPGEVGDLAADVHPHLEDRRLVLRDRAA